MEELKNYSLNHLQKCSYRYLQRIAKAMTLPSNVKKVHLINMIRAKKLATPGELEQIIQRVRLERQQAEKKHLFQKIKVQGSEVSSTSTTISPAIGNTPKRSTPLIIRYPRACIDGQNHLPSSSVVLKHKTYPSPQKHRTSDRILRSNFRSPKKSYCGGIARVSSPIANVNNKLQTTKEPIIKIFRQDQIPKLSDTYVIRQLRPTLTNTTSTANVALTNRNGNRQLVPNQHNQVAPITAYKRQRTISGIYPLTSQEKPPKCLIGYTKTVGIQREDGTPCKINAIVQKVIEDSVKNSNKSIQIPRRHISDKAVATNKISNVVQTFRNPFPCRPVMPNPSSNLPYSFEAPPNGNQIVCSSNKTLKGIRTIKNHSNYQAIIRNPIPRTLYNAATHPNINEISTVDLNNTQYFAKRQIENLDINSNNPNILRISNLRTYLTKTRPIRNETITRTPNNIQVYTHKNIEQGIQNTNIDHNQNFTMIQSNQNEITAVHRNKPYFSEVEQNLNQITIANQNKTSFLAEIQQNQNQTIFEIDVTGNKVRAEEVQYQRRISFQRENSRSLDAETLPHINDVFTRFNNIHNSDVTKPIYVQVSTESERCVNFPIHTKKGALTRSMLEHFYNFRSDFMTSEPVLQIAPKANTRSIYSTPTIATAVVQQPASATCNEQFNLPSFEQDNQFNVRLLFDSDMSEQNSSMETLCTEGTLYTQDSEANVTTPDMVKDALEIISQDGDYMERTGMDIRTQCVSCAWAGPRLLLEYHIRREHGSHIMKQEKNEWNITYTLGSLIGKSVWSCQIIEYDCDLYFLSVKYEDPDLLMAMLWTLSPETDLPKLGSITIYNKVSGEPYSWKGEILQIPADLPNETNVQCLKLQLSKMDLLPNSAKLTLLNGELVTKSSSKVVVGQPELNDIHVILFVKILD